MLRVSAGRLSGASAVPFAEAAALASDQVEGFPRGAFAEGSAAPFAEAAALASDHVEGFPLVLCGGFCGALCGSRRPR